MNNLGKYRKGIVAFIGFAVVALTAVLGNNPPAWFQPLISLLAAIGVYQLPNDK